MDFYLDWVGISFFLFFFLSFKDLMIYFDYFTVVSGNTGVFLKFYPNDKNSVKIIDLKIKFCCLK